MEIVALSGYARTGKDEAARVLVDEYGFTQVAFADKLREMIYQLNPIVHQNWNVTATGELTASTIYLQEVIEHYGWHGYKETPYGPEIRRLLQRLGTEAGRQTLWDSIWIDAAFAGLPDDAKVVVSDARFFNEFDAVKKRGGTVWRIERDGIGPLNDHASETEATDYPRFDIYINNFGTLEDWRNNIRGVYESEAYKIGVA